MKEKISRGITFHGITSTIGFVFLVAGIIAVILSEFRILAGIVILISIVPCLSIRGVIIDYNSMKIKPYLDCLIFKPGKWHKLVEYDRLSLRLFSESQTMNMVSISNTYTTRTFDVTLESKKYGDILIRDFTNYDDAKFFMEKYSVKLNTQATDYIALILERRNKKNH